MSTNFEVTVTTRHVLILQAETGHWPTGGGPVITNEQIREEISDECDIIDVSVKEYYP
jgi:hypothetical protein